MLSTQFTLGPLQMLQRKKKKKAKSQTKFRDSWLPGKEFWVMFKQISYFHMTSDKGQWEFTPEMQRTEGAQGFAEQGVECQDTSVVI